MDAVAAIVEWSAAGDSPLPFSQEAQDPLPGPHSALQALCLVARLHQVAADAPTLAHQPSLPPSEPLTRADLLRAAKYLRLKAKISRTSIEGVQHAPLLAFAVMPPAQSTLREVTLAQSDCQRVMYQEITGEGSISREPRLVRAGARS